MDDLALFKAVQGARADVAEGVRLAEAANHAARRYKVNRDAVVAYVQCAEAACRKAADQLEDTK